MDCNFCGIRIPQGTEYIFVTSKGKALYFCSSKCYKNLVKLNRKPRETKWTKSYISEKEARMKTMEHKSDEVRKEPPTADEAKPAEAKKAEKPKAKESPAKKAKSDAPRGEEKAKPKKQAK
jgi:large subunit ribosomal protein L24e